MSNVIPVIMAGGAGTRLWPLSRDEKPKQFHNLSGSGTLLEETIRRLLPLDPEKVLTITSRKYADLTETEMGKFSIPGVILSEPRPRNTAAAILYAAKYLEKESKDSIMIVLPADHFITETDQFIATLKTAVAEAEKDNLVTIGIKPTYPETGYGYIKAEEGSGSIRPVDRFVEKPDLEKAKEYCDSGNYFWNSGIFIWKTSVIMDQFNSLMPDLVNGFSPMNDMKADDIVSNDSKIWNIKESIFNSIESVSIDYGILENAKNRVVIPADFGWADLGSWKAIDDILPADDNMNRTPSPDNTIFYNSSGCSVFAESGKVAVAGLKDIVVVEADGHILVIDKASSQDVKKIVELVKKK